MAIVREFMIGNIQIAISDEYYAYKSEEERQRDKEIAIRNVGNIGRRAYFKQCEREPCKWFIKDGLMKFH